MAKATKTTTDFEALRSGGIANLIPADAPPREAEIARRVLAAHGEAQRVTDQHFGAVGPPLEATLATLQEWADAYGLAMTAVLDASAALAANPGKVEVTVDKPGYQRSQRVFQ
jgi:hypothetical protein